MTSSQFSYQQIPFSQISEKNDWSLHPWTLKELPEALLHSLDTVGILHPPTLLPKESEGEYEILCGYRRFIFAQNNNPGGTILCRCFHKRPEGIELLNIICEDQKCNAEGLTVAEKARFLQIAEEVERGCNTETFLSALELKKNPELLTNLSKLLDQETSLIEDVHSGRIPFQVFSELLRLNSACDRAALVELFSQLQLGAGKQRRFLQQLRDCAYAQGIEINTLLKEREIQQILNQDQLNTPQKIQHLGNILLQRLQPNLRQAEEDFKLQVQELQLPDNQKLEHSPAFEKDEVKLTITFENFTACQTYLTHRETSTSSIRKNKKYTPVP